MKRESEGRGRSDIAVKWFGVRRREEREGSRREAKTGERRK